MRQIKKLDNLRSGNLLTNAICVAFGMMMKEEKLRKNITYIELLSALLLPYR